MPTATLYDAEIAPTLAEHVGSEFEKFCRRWVRATQPVSKVAGWWGPALHPLRKEGTRSTEEIDIVATSRGRVTLVGDARWRSKPMGVEYLGEIDTYKLPALRRSELKVVERPQIVLFSRNGYTDRLQAVAGERDDVTLIDIPTVLTTLV